MEREKREGGEMKPLYLQSCMMENNNNDRISKADCGIKIHLRKKKCKTIWKILMALSKQVNRFHLWHCRLKLPSRMLASIWATIWVSTAPLPIQLNSHGWESSEGQLKCCVPASLWEILRKILACLENSPALVVLVIWDWTCGWKIYLPLFFFF